MKQNPAWKAYLKSLSVSARLEIALAAVERLMEMDEVRFTEGWDFGPGDRSGPKLYWESWGGDLRGE